MPGQRRRVVAMAAAARQMHSVLKAYAAVETKPEFLTELVDTVDECKRCCITPRDLMDASARTEGTLAQKLEELSLLLEAYDNLCSRGKRDPRDQMTWLLERLEDGDFGENHVFYIDGFPDFTRQHMAILEHLIRVSPAVTVGLNCDCPDSGALAFEKAGATASELLRCAKNAGIPVQIQTVQAPDSGKMRLCQALFQGKLPQPEELAGRLKVFRADSIPEEIRGAADHVMELVRGGCRYRDICIVCGDIGAYGDALRMTFRRYGIPVYLSGTEEIRNKTVIATVLSALEAALGGFEQRDVLRYLKSILSPLDADVCDHVENYVITWGIRGSGFLKPWEYHPDGLGEMWSEEAYSRLAALNRARESAMEPLKRLSERFRQAENLAGQVNALYDFLEEIRLAERLQALAAEMDAAGENREAQILNQLWEILLCAMEQMYDVLGQTVWEPETFLRLFTMLLGQYDVGTIPPVLDAVTVGPANAMRCQQEKHLCVLGAEEGKLPGYGGSRGLLTDQERVTLREMGVPLTGGSVEGLQAEFAEIYGVFCGGEDTVYVSCPEGQPSYVFCRLAEMAGGAEEIPPSPGAAAANAREAGAYLAQWDAWEAAQGLGVADWYDRASRQVAYAPGIVRPENIRGLYGSRLNLSASQADRQAECRMAYFLRYGMRAKERKEAAVDPAEFGSFVHDVLEKTARDVMEMGGFDRVSLEKTLEIAGGHADAYAQERFRQLDSQRLAYLFRRNSRELEMVVTELWQELKQSQFRPHSFELAFGDRAEMPSIAIPSKSMPAALRGFVDRVDLWEKDGQNYFRVVDYKTGKRDFDYCDVYNGVGLQMLLYLFALEASGGQVLGPDASAAGVLYFPARAPVLSADSRLTEEEAALARQKEWRRRGLLLRDDVVLWAMEPQENPVRLCCTRKKDGTLTGDLADLQQLRQLRDYVFRLLGGMVDTIASGNVEPNPYTRGTSHNACAFCPYGAVCRERAEFGRRNYKAMTAQRFWEALEKEEAHHGR
ncbi:MAG: PD-(D/E)XK nuclease family protein [Firmicutes bacterium]|nr:PD-(D/E)XK nuclease family protein [Bacillota bacterium]